MGHHSDPETSLGGLAFFSFFGSCRNFYDIVCAVGGLGVLSLIFCILAPILAIGWIFLPLTHGMYTFTAFVILYTITQNLPKYYSRRYKDGPLHRPLINALETYVTDCKVFKECDLDPERNYIFAWHPHGRMFYGFGMLIGLFSKWFPEITGRYEICRLFSSALLLDSCLRLAFGGRKTILPHHFTKWPHQSLTVHAFPAHP